MDYELIFWVVAGIIGLIGLGVLWVLSKSEEENYVNVERWK